jgi:hypothetical protein
MLTTWLVVRFPTISPQCERPRQPLYARARKRIFGELALAVPLKPLYAGPRKRVATGGST